ncbi:hypothetical protein U1Q18_030863 [Sarracenia purpurea var. burkii]
MKRIRNFFRRYLETDILFLRYLLFHVLLWKLIILPVSKTCGFNGISLPLPSEIHYLSLTFSPESKSGGGIPVLGHRCLPRHRHFRRYDPCPCFVPSPPLTLSNRSDRDLCGDKERDFGFAATLAATDLD